MRAWVIAVCCLLAGCASTPPAGVDQADPDGVASPVAEVDATEMPSPGLATPTIAFPAPPRSSPSFPAFLGNLHSGGYGSIAVGEELVLASSHDELGLFQKDGTLVARETHNAFFASVLPPGEGLSDPRVTYDVGARRYYVVAASGPMNGGCQPGRPHCPNTWTMAVSRDATPDSLDPAAWRFWSFDATQVDGRSTDLWGDFSAIAADDEILVVNGQMGTHFPTSAAFDRILVYDKEEIFGSDGAVMPRREFHNFTDPRNDVVLSGRILPALRMDAGNDGVYFVHYGLRDCDLVVGKVAGPAASAELTLRNVHVAGNCFAWIPGEQPDDPRPILIPPVITSPPIHRGDLIWIAETVPVDHPSGVVNGLRVVALDVSRWPETPTIIEDLTFSVEGVHFANPALAVDERGGIGVGFSAVGGGLYLSAYEIHRASEDEEFSDPRPVVNGTARIDYPRAPPNGTLRFGGYSGAALDPADGSIWIAASYVHQHCVWGIWVARLDLSTALPVGEITPAASPAVPLSEPCPGVALSPYDGRPP